MAFLESFANFMATPSGIIVPLVLKVIVIVFLFLPFVVGGEKTL